MAGTDVAVLQAVLSARGYYTGALDGVFGDVLDAAVRKFQMDHDLVVDGSVPGSATFLAGMTACSMRCWSS